jgi:hypothetical protein
MNMFHTIRRFIEDFRLAIGEAASDEAEGGEGRVVSLGTSKKKIYEARLRLTIQIILTFLVLSLCAYVIVRPGTSDSSVKLAHMGFGVVMGYWFR